MAYELFSKYETPDNGYRTPQDDTAIFEYIIEFIDDETMEARSDVIVGVSDSHAQEEALYECSSQVYNIRRNQFLYWQ